jgi:heat shock protein HslJ
VLCGEFAAHACNNKENKMPFFANMPLLAMALIAGTIGMTVDLAGNGWQASQVAAFTVPEDAHLFVKFGSDGRISGNGGCNAFFGAYTVSGNTIKIGQLLSTRKGCPGLMQTEVKFLSLLESADTYEIKDNKLILFSASGSQLAEFVLADAT